MTAQRKRKVFWLDASNQDSFDPRTWSGNVPNYVRGRLTPTRVKAIREMAVAHEFTQVELADMFGTTVSNINIIIKRKTWKWL